MTELALPNSKKWGLWYGTCGLALLLLADGFLFLPRFPLGLFTFFGVIKSSTSESATDLLTGLGWIMYLVLTVLASRTKSKRAYFALYTVLCIALILNVVGCRAVLDELKDLH